VFWGVLLADLGEEIRVSQERGSLLPEGGFGMTAKVSVRIGSGKQQIPPLPSG
jgi:hypothetical protein